MTLTVPTSGVIGGRSANVQIATPDTGAVISEFGSKIAALGTQWKDAQDDFKTRSTQLSMTSDLANARLEAEQAGDPVASGQIWDQRKAEIAQKYLPVDANGKSTLSPKQAEALQLTFQGLDGQHTFALAEKSVNWTRSKAQANWMQSRDQITTLAVTADPESFAAYLALGEAEIAAQEAQGLMDPAAAEANRQALRQDLFRGRADAQIDADPEAFLAAADKGEFDAMGGELLSSRRDAANKEIARRNAAALKAAEAEAEQKNKAIGDRLTDMSSMFAEGLKVTDEALLSDPEVQAHPKFAEAMAAKSLRDEMPNIRQMTPAELRAAIAAEEAAPKTHKYQAERLATLRTWEAEATKRWNTDGPAAARSAGLPVPDLPAFDPAAPEGFAKGIGERIAFDSFQRKQGYSTGQAIFSPDETAQIKAVLAPEAAAQPKLAMAQAILAGSSGQPEAVTGIIGADPVFSRALRLLRDTGNAGLVTQMLEGQQKEKLGTISLPPKPQRQMILADVLGDSFAASPAQEAEIMEAASALYAANAAGVNPDGSSGIVPFADDTEAQDMFRMAVQQVTGASADRSGNLTIGGLQEFNGSKVVLPAGVPVASVESAWDVVDNHLRGAVWDEKYQDFNFTPGNGADPMRALKAASIDQSAPSLGSGSAAYVRWREARPVRVGDTDIYELVITRDGRTFKVPREGDPQGRAWRFRMPDLLRGAQK
jgi:hypothetical protein